MKPTLELLFEKYERKDPIFIKEVKELLDFWVLKNKGDKIVPNIRMDTEIPLDCLEDIFRSIIPYYKFRDLEGLLKMYEKTCYKYNFHGNCIPFRLNEKPTYLGKVVSFTSFKSTLDKANKLKLKRKDIDNILTKIIINPSHLTKMELDLNYNFYPTFSTWNIENPKTGTPFDFATDNYKKTKICAALGLTHTWLGKKLIPIVYYYDESSITLKTANIANAALYDYFQVKPTGLEFGLTRTWHYDDLKNRGICENEICEEVTSRPEAIHNTIKINLFRFMPYSELRN